MLRMTIRASRFGNLLLWLLVFWSQHVSGEAGETHARRGPESWTTVSDISILSGGSEEYTISIRTPNVSLSGVSLIIEMV